MMVYGSKFQPRLNALAIRGFNPSNWRLPNPVASTRLVLRAPSNAPSLLTPVQQIVAIGVGIFTSFLSAISTFFAWQTYRRAKAQEILVQLQIAKLRAELAEYDEKARKKQAESGIILATLGAEGFDVVSSRARFSSRAKDFQERGGGG
jgi:hypothetical protein